MFFSLKGAVSSRSPITCVQAVCDVGCGLDQQVAGTTGVVSFCKVSAYRLDPIRVSWWSGWSETVCVLAKLSSHFVFVYFAASKGGEMQRRQRLMRLCRMF